MAFLQLVKGALPGTRFVLSGDRAVIGRSAECEVPLDVPAVSRRHAVVSRDRGRFFIEDLNSRNGTFLNDSKVVDRTPLRDGDQLVICDQEFRFYSGNASSFVEEDESSGRNGHCRAGRRLHRSATRQRDGHVRRQRRLGELAAIGQARSEARRPVGNLQQPGENVVGERNSAEAVGQSVQDLCAGRSRLRGHADQGGWAAGARGRQKPAHRRRRADAHQPHDHRRSDEIAEGDPVGRCGERRAIRHGAKHRRFFDSLDDLRTDDRQRRQAAGRDSNRYAESACPLYGRGFGSAGRRGKPGGRGVRQCLHARAGGRPAGDAARLGTGATHAANAAAVEAAAGARVLFLRLLPGGAASRAAITTITCSCRAGGSR